MRFRHWKLNQWKELVEDLEADIVRVHGRTADSTRGIELISEGQMSRGSKALLSKGISNIASNEAINQQMKSKFPSRKMAIPSPSEAQWNEERASIDKEILRTTIMSLKSQVSPGLSGFRYEHLQPILFSEHSKSDRLAKSAFDELHSLSNDTVQGQKPCPTSV